MKKVVTFSATVLAALVLTACGSGGGKGGHSASQSSATAPSNSSNLTRPTNTNTQPTVNNGTGGAFVLDSSRKFSNKVLATHEDFKKFIVVDGKKVAITKDLGPNSYIKNWFINREQGKTTHFCCGVYESVRFGGVDEGNANIYFYYNGIPTKETPATGKASYAGHFIASAGGVPAYQDKAAYLGKATFDVDFGAKTLSGQLTHDQANLKPISITATINGNNFGGTATSPELKGNAVVEGKFYGDKAKELGGLFLNAKDRWGGAFGAAKQ